MTTQQRTPGPWSITTATGSEGYTNTEITAWPTTICKIPRTAGTPFLANAVFIVTACNAHDELVAALQDARDALADLNHREEDGGLLMDKIDAALAKVGEAGKVTP